MYLKKYHSWVLRVFFFRQNFTSSTGCPLYIINSQPTVHHQQAVSPQLGKGSPLYTNRSGLCVFPLYYAEHFMPKCAKDDKMGDINGRMSYTAAIIASRALSSEIIATERCTARTHAKFPVKVSAIQEWPGMSGPATRLAGRGKFGTLWDKETLGIFQAWAPQSKGQRRKGDS